MSGSTVITSVVITSIARIVYLPTVHHTRHPNYTGLHPDFGDFWAYVARKFVGDIPWTFSVKISNMTRSGFHPGAQLPKPLAAHREKQVGGFRLGP